MIGPRRRIRRIERRVPHRAPADEAGDVAHLAHAGGALLAACFRRIAWRFGVLRDLGALPDRATLERRALGTGPAIAAVVARLSHPSYGRGPELGGAPLRTATAAERFGDATATRLAEADPVLIEAMRSHGDVLRSERLALESPHQAARQYYAERLPEHQAKRADAIRRHRARSVGR